MELKDKKSVQAINYFARKEENHSINRLKLMKLLWLSDRLHLLRYGRLILDDKYVAMPHGPVPSNTLNISKNKNAQYISEFLKTERYHLESVADSRIGLFSGSEIEVMDEIWVNFGQLTNFQLRDLSHFYPEWKRFEEDIKMTNSSFEMYFEDFFVVPLNTEKSNYKVFSKENMEQSKEIFDELNYYRSSSQ